VATRTKTIRFGWQTPDVVEEMFYDVWGRDASGAYVNLITRRGGSANGVFQERKGVYGAHLTQWDRAWTDWAVYWDQNDANAPYLGERDTWSDVTHVNAKPATPANGGGAFAVTVTVTNIAGGAAIVGASVRMTDASGSYDDVTDGSGVAHFNLNSSSYTLGVFKDGYLYAPTTRVVSGATSLSAAVTQVSITPPSDPAQTTGYTVVRDARGTVKPFTTLYFQLVDSPGTAANAYDRRNLSAQSDGAGLLQVGLMKSRHYKARFEKQKTWTDIPDTGSASTFQLPEILSDYGS
jgi:hypothetical protein